VDRENREELAFHVERLVREKVEAGVSEPDARRQARLEVGDVDLAREDLAGTRTGFALEQLGRECRQAVRALGRSPATTIVAVCTMAVGIGASAALFTLVDAVVLRPLPYPDADRLVRVFDTNATSGVERSGITTGNLYDWRRRAEGLSGIAGYYVMGRTLSVGSEAEAVIAAQVTEDFFEVVGVPPAIGRPFTAAETARATFSNASMPTGTDPVIVLSHEVWQSRLGGDPEAIGRTVLLERLPFTVVGVMPPGFALPAPDVQVWIPWHVDAESPRDQHYVGGLARLAPGQTLATARQHLARVAADLGEVYPASNAGWSVQLVPLHDEVVGASSGVLWLLLAAVGLLLLVACANVALMTFTRGLDRAGEVAVRLALGASSGRLLRGFLTESAIQAAAAGVIGLGLAMAGLRLLPAMAPSLPRLGEVGFSAATFVFACGVTALTAVLSGLPHAWKRSKLQPVAALVEASRRTTSAGSHAGLRHGLAVAQLALAVVLLAGASLLVRSVQNLAAADAGFDARNVLVVPVFLDSQAYTSGERVRAYYRILFERLTSLPNVVSVGGSTTVPTSPLGPDFARPVWRADAASIADEQVPAWVRIVTAGYISTMGMRVTDGRAIDERDLPKSPPVVMISEGLARQLWPTESAVGRQLVVDYSTAGTYPYEIVGVVADVRFRGPRVAPEREIYLAHAQRSYLIMNVVVRTAGNPAALTADVRRVMRAVDPHKPPQDVQPLGDLLRATYARDRLTMTVLVWFAGTAAFLAMLSVYGVLSRLVRERQRDLAIRMAMGADGAALRRWISAAGLRLVCAGLAVGVAATILGRRLLSQFLFGIAPTDPATLAVVMLAVGLFGAVATLVPCYRATTIDPVEILRRG
jgi:predicted permease